MARRRRLGVAFAVTVATIGLTMPSVLRAEVGDQAEPLASEPAAQPDGTTAQETSSEPVAPTEATVAPEGSTTSDSVGSTDGVPTADSTADVPAPADEGGTAAAVGEAAATPTGITAQDAPDGALSLLARAAGNRGGGQEKVTICHRTGSETNPFVEITIALPALAAHLANHGDIYPVPPGGCPGASEEPTDVEICHATGSEQNPYVVITIPEAALPAHLGHGDIFPVPEAGCPVPEESVDVCHATGSETDPFAVITIPTSALPEHLDHGDIFPVPEGGCPQTAEVPTDPPGGGGGGVGTEGGSGGSQEGGSGSADPERASATRKDPEELPFTGLSVLTLALVGAALAYLGWTLHRAYGAGALALDGPAEEGPPLPIVREAEDSPSSTGRPLLVATLVSGLAAYLGWTLNRR